MRKSTFLFKKMLNMWEREIVPYPKALQLIHELMGHNAIGTFKELGGWYNVGIHR